MLTTLNMIVLLVQ